jgi:hypothetical protein
MPDDSGTPLLDMLLDRRKLADRVVEVARREVRHQVVDAALKGVVAPRVDEVLRRVRGNRP